MIHGGLRYYGVVDQAKGGAFVATRFVHLWYFPLLPIQSMIGRDGEDPNQASWVGVPIALSIKSVLFAWARAVLAFWVIMSLMLALVPANELLRKKARKPARALVAIVICLGAGSVGYAVRRATFWLGGANDRRAAHLTALLDGPPPMPVKPATPPPPRAAPSPDERKPTHWFSLAPEPNKEDDIFRPGF